MIKVVQAEEKHVESLDLTNAFKHKDAAMYAKLSIGNKCPAYALMNEDVCIGVLFGAFLYPGVMEVSGLFGTEIYKNKIAFHKTLLTLAEMGFDLFKLHRIQICVKESFVEGNKFALALGFLPEGIMRKYGPDKENYVLYGKVKDGC